MNSKILSPIEVKEKLKTGKNDFLIVDIREPHEYNDWNIKGSINNPVNSLLVKGEYALIKEQLKTLPKDKFIITVCLRGINSQVISSVLQEMGYNTASLEKGMKGWNENFDIYEIDFADFTVVQFVRIGKGCLSYIVYSKQDKTAAVIEASIFKNEYTKYARENNINIKYVFDTHSHADHFSGGMSLAKELGVNYYISSTDVDSNFEYESLKNKSSILLGNISVKIIPTPGHTDGSVSFMIDNKALICGDLLLLESPGRPDLARTKKDTKRGAGILFNTLQNVIFKLDNSVKIFPSHFTKTEIRPVVISLRELKQSSEPLRIENENEFIEYLTSNIPITPPNFESIKKLNKAGAIIPLDYAEDLEIGPNRCAAR